MSKASKQTLINKEYKRLKKLFENCDEGKLQLVEELLKKASFLKVELEELEVTINENGFVEITSKGESRVSVQYKIYLQSVAIYQGIIKTLNSIFGKQVVKDDDDFNDFIEKAGG